MQYSRMKQHQHNKTGKSPLLSGVFFYALQDGACLCGYQGTLLTPAEPSVTSNHSSISAGLLSSNSSPHLFSLDLLCPSSTAPLFPCKI